MKDERLLLVCLPSITRVALSSVSSSFSWEHLFNFSDLLVRHDLLVAHGSQERDRKRLILRLRLLKSLLQLTGIVIRVGGQLDILAHVTILLHEGQKTVVGDVDQVVIFAHNNRDVRVVGSRNNIFVLLVGKDIKSSEIALRVSVLARLGSGHSGHLARLILDAHETPDADLTSLRVVHVRCSGIFNEWW